MSKKQTEETQAVANTASEETLAILKNEVPVETSFTKTYLPRIVFNAKTKLDENENVLRKAGTFIIQRKKGEEWEEEVIGTELEANFIFHRRQLRYYDEKAEQYISSPVYGPDNIDTEIIPLFQDRHKIDEGTEKELQAKYPPKEGRKTSSLEDERVLFVLYKGGLFNLSVKGGSKWAFMKFARDVMVAGHLVQVTSEDMEKGSNKWKQMKFSSVRPVTEEEAREILSRVQEIKAAIAAEKAYYATTAGGAVQNSADDYEVIEKF